MMLGGVRGIEEGKGGKGKGRKETEDRGEGKDKLEGGDKRLGEKEVKEGVSPWLKMNMIYWSGED